MIIRNSIQILGVPLNTLTRAEAARQFVAFCDGGKQVYTATPNAEILLEAQKNPQLLSYLQKCGLNTPDSVSLLWAGTFVQNHWSRFRAIFELCLLPLRKSSWKAFPERVSGSDLFLDVCAEAEKREKSIFLLGGLGDTAQRVKNILAQRFPELKILGGISGSPFEKDDDWVVEKVNAEKPDILFLAYGCPLQELWIERNLKKCPSVKVAMGIGGTFDFVAGNLKRAPKLFQILGLEWLWRLILQPSRWKRIFHAVVVFPFTVLK